MNKSLEIAAELLATLYKIKLRQSKRCTYNDQKRTYTAKEFGLVARERPALS